MTSTFTVDLSREIVLNQKIYELRHFLQVTVEEGMAGGSKKKKKPISNPARGFATTSTISKSRITETDLPQPNKDTGSKTSIINNDGPDVVDDDVDNPTQLEYKDLTPEQLEQELEKVELQQVVDKYASKVHREVARQVSQLETDRRLTRGHAETLSTRSWLGEDFMIEIGQKIKEVTLTDLVSKETPGETSEETLVIRFWTLQAVLQKLQIQSQLVAGAIEYMLTSIHLVHPLDTVWGLPEALEWIAYSHQDGELHAYDRQAPQISGNDSDEKGNVSVRLLCQ